MVESTQIYSIKEIVEKNHLEITERLINIKENVEKTNGRVTALEKSKNMFMGALIFMNVIVVPIAVAAIIKFVGLNK